MPASCPRLSPELPLLPRFSSLRLQVTVKARPLTFFLLGSSPGPATLDSSQGTLSFFALLPPCSCLSLPPSTKPRLYFQAKVKLQFITLCSLTKAKVRFKWRFGLKTQRRSIGRDKTVQKLPRRPKPTQKIQESEANQDQPERAREIALSG